MRLQAGQGLIDKSPLAKQLFYWQQSKERCVCRWIITCFSKGERSSVPSLSPGPLLPRLNFLRRVGGAASRSPHDSHILPTAHKSVMGLFRFSNVHKYPFGSYQGKELILCQEKKKMSTKCWNSQKVFKSLGRVLDMPYCCEQWILRKCRNVPVWTFRPEIFLMKSSISKDRRQKREIIRERGGKQGEKKYKTNRRTH